MTAPKQPFEHMVVRLGNSGLWIAEEERRGDNHPLGLVVPEASSPIGPTLILPFRPVVRDGTAAYVTDRELELPPLTRADIVSALQFMPSEITFTTLAVLLSRISQIRTDAAAHLALAREIFGDAPVMEQLKSWCATQGHVIFSEQALFALISQAVIHCRHDSRQEFVGDEWLAFTRLIFASTALLHDDPETGDLDDFDENNPEPFLAYMTQNLLFNATSNFGSSLARTWRMFGELGRDPARAWNTHSNLDTLLDHIGLTIEQQMGLAFSLYAALGIGTGRVALLPSAWRSACERVAPDSAPAEIIKCISATPGEMRAELTSEEARRFDPDLRWSSVPFIERPFLRLSDDRLLLVSPRGIEGWPTDGIHYRLLRAASQLDPDNGAQRFTAFAGELTEVSTLEMIKDAHARARERHPEAGHVCAAQPMRSGGESADVFVQASADIVVMEVSSSRITASTRLTGDIRALQRDLEKTVIKRVKQLHRTIDALREDEFPAMPSATIRRIFPVIVNVEPMRWTPMLHAYLRREVPGLLRQRGVQPLQFIELEDMEALMSVVGPQSLAQLLDQKINEAGIDPEVLQWFVDSPLAPKPSRPAIVIERLDRQFNSMSRSLGFDPALMGEWKAERQRLP